MGGRWRASERGREENTCYTTDTPPVPPVPPERGGGRVIRGANTLTDGDGGLSHLRPTSLLLLLRDVSQSARSAELHLPLSRKLKLIITVSVSAAAAAVVERRDNGGCGRGRTDGGGKNAR